MAASVGQPLSAGHSGPNMTPMVDVVMCILIFFMLASSFLMPEWLLKSQMPAIDKGPGGPATPSALPAVRVFIQMTREGGETWVSAFDFSPMKLQPAAGDNAALKEAFARKGQTMGADVHIILQPQASVPWQDVITIYDTCVNARFKQVAFAPAG